MTKQLIEGLAFMQALQAFLSDQFRAVPIGKSIGTCLEIVAPARSDEPSPGGRGKVMKAPREAKSLPSTSRQQVLAEKFAR